MKKSDEITPYMSLLLRPGLVSSQSPFNNMCHIISCELHFEGSPLLLHIGCLCQVIPKKNDMLVRGTGDSCLLQVQPKHSQHACCSWCSQEREMKVIPKHLLTDDIRPIRNVSALLRRTEHSVLIFLLQHSVK